MSKKVWTTTSNHQANLRMFGLSFPNKFDYPEFYRLGKKKALTEAEQQTRRNMMLARLEVNEKYRIGKKLSKEIIPNTLYGKNIRKNIEFPGFCRTPEGNILLNEKCANVLKKFRLGETEMYPLSFFDVELNEPVNDKTYYLLNIAEWRNYFKPEYSSKSLHNRGIKNENYDFYYLLESKYMDHAIAVSKCSLICDLDLWHDPALTSSIFVSDELKIALDEAGVGTDWLLYECLVTN